MKISPSVLSGTLEGAVMDITDAIAINRGWTSLQYDDEEDQEYQYPGAADELRALREPLPLASVFAALYQILGIEPTPLVKQAAEGLPTVPVIMRRRGFDAENVCAHTAK